MNDINLAEIERRFSASENQPRFARFCNAVILAEAKGPLPTLPRLDDSPGADGGFDGSWTLPDSPQAVNALPFAHAGWNALQYKARSLTGGATRAFNGLKQAVRGAAAALITRASRPGELRRYTLFTNLRLGRPEKSSTATGALASRRDELVAAIREGLPASESVHVEIVEAGFLQTVVNRHPALRETFFGDQGFHTWDDAWALLAKQPYTKPDAPLIGRSKELALLQAKLGDPGVAFIGLPGASGMGKTRLALEATRDISARTFVVRAGAKAAFLGKHLGAYATTQRSIFFVEDLRFGEAQALAEQAALHPGICILASIPAEEHLPRFGLGETPAVCSLRLAPLNPNDSRELLRSVRADFDHDAFEQVVQEAGGNPQVLLVAAALGKELRTRFGQLRRQIAQSFLRKAKAILGDEVEPVLELLSVLSPFDVRKEAHVQVVRSALALPVDTAAIRRFHDRLVDAAFVESSGRRGDELNVSPPLLATHLLERALAGAPQRALGLYEQLDENGRRRLLDRLISVDSPEGHGLWAHVFGRSGPFATKSGLENNIDSLRILARAAPRQTAEFLRSRACIFLRLLGRKKVKVTLSLASILADTSGRSKRNQRIDHFRSCMHTILHELVDHPDSSHAALGLLEQVALAGADAGNGFAKLFTECFVPWYYRFPLHPSERQAIVSRLLCAPHAKQRELGHGALFAITDPPHTLSAQAVERRRMGAPQSGLTMGEIWDYHCRAFELHLAVATKVGPGRAQANERLTGAIGQLRRLPPARVMPLLRKLSEALWRGKLTLQPGHFLGCLIDTRERFSETWTKHANAEWATGIPAFITELDQMIARVDKGPLKMRLAIWIDRQPSFGWDTVPGTKQHRYEVEIDKLAAEAVARPRAFTLEMVATLIGNRSTHAAEFAGCLGRHDRKKLFWSRLAALQEKRGGAWIFGSYCDGVAMHDPKFVEAHLDRVMHRAGASMLMVLKKLGPTPANRRRLLELVKARRVTPIELAGMFQSGRWLDELPVPDVKNLLGYIGQDCSPEATYELLQVFSLYLHGRKKVPILLRPLVTSALLRPAQHHQDTDHDSDHLAELLLKSNLSAGVRLFRRLMAAAVAPKWEARGWNPVSGLTSSMDFYRLVRTKSPRMVYTAVFEYLGTKNRVDVLNHDSSLFDVQQHARIILDLTKKYPARAAVIARNLRHDQPDFWPFVYALLAQHPAEVALRRALTSVLADDMPWGYLDEETIDAGLQLVNRQLTESTTPPHGRAFLEQVKAELIKRDQSGASSDEE